MKQKTPARSNLTVLQQLLNLIPLRLVGRHARGAGVEAMARTFSVRSHLAAMLFAQLSHANKHRDVDFVEKLFWSTLAHRQHACPSFAAGRRGKGLLRRFKVRGHAVDSTVMQLVANGMDWAKHRRRKAAAKMHLRLDLHSFLTNNLALSILTNLL